MRTEQYNCVRGLIAFVVVCAVILPWLAGCQGVPIASARFTGIADPLIREPTPAKSPPPVESAPSEPVEEVVPTAADLSSEPLNVPRPPVPVLVPDPPPERDPHPERPMRSETTPETRSVPEPGSLPPPRAPATIPSERIHAPGNAVQRAVNSTGGVDPQCTELSGGQVCPPLVTIPRCRLWHRMGPLFSRNAPYDAQALAEAELQPPFARFHPVPTAPVFASHTDYESPQLMMEPVKQPGHLPRPFAPRGEPGRFESAPDDAGVAPIPPPPEVIPIPEASSDQLNSPSAPVTSGVPASLNWRTRTIHKHR